MLTDKGAILQHWSQHFGGLFSDQCNVQESSQAKIPQADVKLELNDPPTREEIKKTTMQLKAGKSPGIDGIPAEIYQHRGDAALDKLHDLVTNCWEKRTLPEDLRDAVTVSLSLCTKTKERNQTVQTTKASPYSPLQAKSGSHPVEQAHANDSTGKHTRKPAWVQVQQRDDRHDLRAEVDSEEMQTTERGSK